LLRQTVERSGFRFRIILQVLLHIAWSARWALVKRQPDRQIPDDGSFGIEQLLETLVYRTWIKIKLGQLQE